jgi:hypothetical protein
VKGGGGGGTGGGGGGGYGVSSRGGGGGSGGGVGELWNVGSVSSAGGTQGGGLDENTSSRNHGSSLTGLSIASIRLSVSNATSGRRSTLSSVQGENGGQSLSSFFRGGSPGGSLTGSGQGSVAHDSQAHAHGHTYDHTQALTSRDKLTLTPKEVEDRQTLTRAHLILPKLATVYLIPAANPSHMPTTQEEKGVVEAREIERTRRW